MARERRPSAGGPNGDRGRRLLSIGRLALVASGLVAATLIVVFTTSTGRSPGPRTASAAGLGSAPAGAASTRAGLTTVSTPSAPASSPSSPTTSAPQTDTTLPAGGPAPTRSSERQSFLAAERRAARRLASHGLPLYCGGREKRMVALTFDDGPGIYTHYAIQKLRAAHLKATFFLVGKEILGWPGLANREKPVAAFGDHTMTHPFLPGLRYRQAIAEITADRRLIERTVHEPVLLFRPPYEATTRAIDAGVRRLGMVEVLWNVDSQDSLRGNYRAIERRVIAGLHPGSIILMHENRGQTIRALDTILRALLRRHLRAVTVPRLILEDPPSLAQLRRGWNGCPSRVAGGNGN